jgi:hypothetical protein
MLNEMLLCWHYKKKKTIFGEKLCQPFHSYFNVIKEIFYRSNIIKRATKRAGKSWKLTESKKVLLIKMRKLKQ